jgi:hypothetical protein
LFPTLLEIAGVTYTGPKELDGKSLQPLIMGADTDWPDRMLVNHWGNRTSVRSQQYRLDQEDRLFDMEADPGQTVDVSENVPTVAAALKEKKENWRNQVLTELPEEDTRSFTIGHPDALYNQLPARDGRAHGSIERSNRWPNCSFYTNWNSISDSISWAVEVLADGDFEVTLYYTCKEENTGAVVALSDGRQKTAITITEAFDPPLRGMENDRSERQNSYVKDFNPVSMGTISLKKGTQTLSLKALEVPGNGVIDFRLLMLKRL